MTIKDRYARSIRSPKLRHREPHEPTGDTEILGAYGLADRKLTNGENCKPAPLAVPLERLFAGDNGASVVIVEMLAQLAFEESFRLKIKVSRVKCEDLAKACLAWHRDGTCKVCGGHGFMKIQGTNVIGHQGCKSCRAHPKATEGTGKIPFERVIHPEEVQPLAAWMVSEMERSMAKAAPMAMRSLSDLMDF